MTIPDEYLELSLRSLVALTGRPHERDTPCEVATIVAALESLEKRLARADAATRAEQCEWLAQQIEALPPAKNKRAQRAKMSARRK